MRIFIYEAITAGALGRDVPASLRREGAAMLSAVALDFERAGHRVESLQNADDRFDELAAVCDWTLVIAPEFDDLLENRSRRVLELGGRLLGSSPDAIHLTGDKLATARHWQNQGVPHPQTEFLDPAEFASFDPPWVIKPRQGAGSQATFLIPTREDEPRVVSEACAESLRGNFIVQRYVPGNATSVALLISPRQTIPLLPADQYLSSDGRFRYQGGYVPTPPPGANRAIHLALRAVAGIPGLLGYVGVDLVLGASSDYVIEVNPRLTTSYIGLRQLCRQNLAELMLRSALAEPIEPPTWREGTVQFEVAAL